MEHWSNEFEHTSVTPENREAFNTHMAKFPTVEDAVADGYGLAKQKGNPFKFPESMDKLPDDESRSDFTSQAHKLLGITHAKSIEDLADMDFKAGSADGVETETNLASAFKQYVVDNDISKGDAQKMIGFYNDAMGKAVIANTTQVEADKLAKAKSVNEALIADPDFGSEEKVKEQSELLRRAVKEKLGLTADEYEEFGQAMADGILTENPVMAKAMLKLLAPLAAEGSTDGGGGGGGGAAEKGLTPYQWKKERWPKTPDSWGNESDTWATQDIQMRKLAGIK